MNAKKIFLFQQALFLLCTLIILLLVFPVAGTIDLKLIHPWISPEGQFFLRNDWYLAQLNYRWVKQLIIAVYVIFFVRWLGSFYRPDWRKFRKPDGYFLILVLVSCGLVGVLKSLSDHACPWNMVEPTAQGFLWNFHLKHGHCFPGGHASTGFALLVGFFIYRLTEKRRAYFYLISALLLGFGLGWAQMMRGAHFLSHNLWTGWIVWAVNVLSYALFYRYLNSGEAVGDKGN